MALSYVSPADELAEIVNVVGATEGLEGVGPMGCMLASPMEDFRESRGDPQGTHGIVEIQNICTPECSSTHCTWK